MNSSAAHNKHLEKTETIKSTGSIHKKRLVVSSIICSLITIIIASVFIHEGLLFKKENQRKDTLKNSITSQINTNQNSLQASNTINQLSGEFKKQINLGAIGFANRLQWTDTIKETARILAIHNINFILKETLKLDDPEHPFYRDDISLNIIEMEISLGTQNEGTVYDFFSRLQQYARGTFTIEECTIARSVTNENINTAAFQTSCTLNWFIIDNPLTPNTMGANL